MTSKVLPWKRSIQTRLTLLALLATLLPVVIVAVLVAIQVNAITRRQIGANVQQLAAASGADVQRFITSRYGDIQVLAASPILTSADTDPVEKQAFLQSVNAAYGIYQAIYVTDAQGHILAATDRTTGDQSDENWFTQATLGEVFISDIYYLTSASDLVMTFSAPMYNEAGELIGVIAAHVAGQTFFNVVGSTQVGEAGQIYLISEDGHIAVARSVTDVFTDASQLASVQQALNGASGITVDTDPITGARSLIAYTPLEGVKNWIAVGSLPLVELNTVIADLLVRILLTGLATVLILGAGVLVVTRNLVRPIHALTESSKRLAGGDFEVQIPLHSPDELGQLADSFRSMTSQIHQSFTAMQESVREARIARAQAEEAARLKSEFVSTMSHELRTPLNAILGFCGILLEGMGGEIDEEAHHMLERIDFNSVRLLNLINEILDLARIEAGRIEIVHEPIAIRELVFQWQTANDVLAQNKGLEFMIDIDQNIPTLIYGDSERLTKVVTNLLSNAFKFTIQGNVTLTLQRLGDHWQISVKDTGIGIPPHALNYIFDEFRQVDGSTSRAYQGSGLGLAIVRNLCTLMGGSVRVQSVLAVGSEFIVTLPLHTGEQLEMPLPIIREVAHA